MVEKSKETKYIIVTGGVMSGLGKGIVSASIGNILKGQGYNVTAVKIDPYINIDAGTMRPTEHGEVWVTYDGGETDMDLGNYERFIGCKLSRKNSITTGQVYLTVIKKERNLEYAGKNVEVIPHIPHEVIRRIKENAADADADFCIVEIGGTVGDYQSVLFLEAVRRMRLAGDCVKFVHVVYLPVPPNLGEMKTKPAQHSVRELNTVGINPDFIIARAVSLIDDIRREKLSTFCNVTKDKIISAPNLSNIYESPVNFVKNGFAKQILEEFGLEYKEKTELFEQWNKFTQKMSKLEKKVKIGIVAKYISSGDYSLSDSYASVIEAIKHASWNNGANPEIVWIDSLELEKDATKLNLLREIDGIIVPGGFGKSGIEGKIMAAKFARENNIPYLGLCYGMQIAVIEYARSVCGMSSANTTEIDEDTKYPVVTILENQKELIKNKKYGGSMRLGEYKAQLKKESLVRGLYESDIAIERHRHRYEINPIFTKELEEKGILFSGTNTENGIAEFMEIPGHKFYVATQAHPEFTSAPIRPNPLFNGFIKACLK